MEPEGLLPHSQVPAICPYPEPVQSSPSLHIPHLKIHLNIILPSKPGSSNWSLSLKFTHQNPVCTSPLPPYLLHAPSISIFSISSPEKYLARNTDHKDPRYIVFSSCLLPRTSWAPKPSSALYSRTP